MTREQKLGAFIAVAFLFIGGGLWYFYRRNLKKLESITFKADKVKVKGNFKRINIQGKLKLTNPSELDVFIEKYNINVYIQEIFVANLTNDAANLSIQPNSNLVFPFNIDVDVAKFAKDLLSVVMAVFVNKSKSDPIAIKFQGTISGKHGIVSVNDFPIDYIYNYNPQTEQ